jgi:hypothetical protein
MKIANNTTAMGFVAGLTASLGALVSPSRGEDPSTPAPGATPNTNIKAELEPGDTLPVATLPHARKTRDVRDLPFKISDPIMPNTLLAASVEMSDGTVVKGYWVDVVRTFNWATFVDGSPPIEATWHGEVFLVDMAQFSEVSLTSSESLRAALEAVNAKFSDVDRNSFSKLDLENLRGQSRNILVVTPTGTKLITPLIEESESHEAGSRSPTTTTVEVSTSSEGLSLQEALEKNPLIVVPFVTRKARVFKDPVR